MKAKQDKSMADFEEKLANTPIALARKRILELEDILNSLCTLRKTGLWCESRKNHWLDKYLEIAKEHDRQEIEEAQA